MHEISLVQGLFQQLKDLADENSAQKITRVTMEIGPLCGVVLDSFQFGFEILSADDEMLRGAKLIVKIPDVSYKCTECGHVEVIAGPRPEECPKCKDLLLIPTGGEDLILLQVEME
ncbi:MAG: hydrogenase accessory protein HypA [Desulfotalea sp.]|nr:MAG: hydrogenase accessory protein HypA [Desulfotalea sp.]